MEQSLFLHSISNNIGNGHSPTDGHYRIDYELDLVRHETDAFWHFGFI